MPLCDTVRQLESTVICDNCMKLGDDDDDDDANNNNNNNANNFKTHRT